MVLAASAVSAVTSQSFSMGAIMAEVAFTSVHTELTSRRGVGSKRAQALTTPLPGTGDFVLTNKDNITSINNLTDKYHNLVMQHI
jgi:curli biogenesis system outer membrane secretion channel CsgG